MLPGGSGSGTGSETTVERFFFVVLKTSSARCRFQNSQKEPVDCGLGNGYGTGLPGSIVQRTRVLQISTFLQIVS